MKSLKDCLFKIKKVNLPPDKTVEKPVDRLRRFEYARHYVNTLHKSSLIFKRIKKAMHIVYIYAVKKGLCDRRATLKTFAIKDTLSAVRM